MGASRGTRARPALVPDQVHPAGPAVAVLDFAVAQILRDDTALGALPAVLERLVTAFGLRAALAFQASGGQPATVLAAHPPEAAGPALLARLGAMSLAQRGSPAPLALEPGERPGGAGPGRTGPGGAGPASVLLARSVPVDGQCLCALALIGDAAGLDEEARVAAHAVAAMVSTQIRHANDLAQLADQTERLNCLIAAAIPGVIITDEQGRVTNVSQSFGTIFGIADPAELVGTSATSVVGRVSEVFADPDEFTRRIVEAFHARQPVSGEQARCADGRTLECDYWPVSVDGHYRGDLWLAWDMSERTELEQRRAAALQAELAGRQLAEQASQQLAEQNERLRVIDENRNQFLAIVSHELRTPLTSIVSFIELIRGEAEGLTPEGLSFLDIIERNADRLHRLVGDLLMLDRLEAGALPLDLTEVSVPELVAEAVRTAEPGAVKQRVKLEVEATEGPPVQGDPRRLIQVMDNLIANAVKFSHRRGRVRVSATWRRGMWQIEVADSGIGIPPEETDKLFKRFVRASNARTAGLPGSGLGLSIVKVLVEMHGGNVDVHSTLGRGSTFSVYLPAAS